MDTAWEPDERLEFSSSGRAWAVGRGDHCCNLATSMTAAELLQGVDSGGSH